MKTYTVTGIVAVIAAGTLRLTAQQAGTRSHAIRPLGDDLFEIIAPVQFKQGETFAYDLEIPRSLAQCLEESELELPLEEMNREQLMAMAKSLDLNPHPKTGEVKLIEAIKARQDEMLKEQVKADRIAELEAKGDDLSDEEKAELESLKA